MRRFVSAFLACTFLLTGCSNLLGRKANTSVQTDASNDATRLVILVMQKAITEYFRLSPNMGLFTSLYLSQSGFVPVIASIRGIASEMRLHRIIDVSNDNETYSLLQEFGSVLHTDVPDLLNNSSDRARTLNEYMAGLQNITERANRKSQELAAAIVELQTDQREKRTTVQEIQREIQTALRDKDYAGAASHQQALAEAQGELSQADTKLKVTQDIQRSYQTLLDIAVKRTQAIEANREILIAGLGVVQIPGVEDLGIIENPSRRGGSTRSGGFFQF